MADKTSDSVDDHQTRWLPLESNPEVMNEFVYKLGLNPAYAFCDVYGLDPDLLQMVPQPCAAVLLLFPITEKYETFRKQEQGKIDLEGQVLSDKVYFLKQSIGNACGTIGLLHALGNNVDTIQLADGPLRRLFDRTRFMTPDERAKALETDEDLAKAHQSCAHGGQTRTPDADDLINLHFICLVEKDGSLYELDGRKPYPINHGPVTDSLLSASARVIKQFIEREKDTATFNVIALAPNEGI